MKNLIYNFFLCSVIFTFAYINSLHYVTALMMFLAGKHVLVFFLLLLIKSGAKNTASLHRTPISLQHRGAVLRGTTRTFKVPSLSQSRGAVVVLEGHPPHPARAHRGRHHLPKKRNVRGFPFKRVRA